MKETRLLLFSIGASWIAWACTPTDRPEPRQTSRASRESSRPAREEPPAIHDRSTAEDRSLEIGSLLHLLPGFATDPPYPGAWLSPEDEERDRRWLGLPGHGPRWPK
jgi:hypothetical protein